MGFDYLLELQKIREGLEEGFSRAINNVTALFVSPLLYMVFAVIYWCMNKRKGKFFILCLAGSNFLNAMLKISFCVFRPWLLNSNLRPYEFVLKDATGYSFPSGHATAAGAILGTFSWEERKRKWLITACVILCLIVGFTRNFLTVHTLQDVLAGFACGILCVVLSAGVMKWVDGKEGRDLVAAGIAFVLLTAGLILTVCRNYPLTVDGEQVTDLITVTKDAYTALGIGYAVTLGLFIERRWIRFETEGSWKVKVIQVLIGGTGAAMLCYLPKRFLYSLLGENWGHFVLYFVAVFYCVAAWPWIWSLLRSRWIRDLEIAEVPVIPEPETKANET